MEWDLSWLDEKKAVDLEQLSNSRHFLLARDL
jgi:hypothetical protein